MTDTDNMTTTPFFDVRNDSEPSVFIRCDACRKAQVFVLRRGGQSLAEMWRERHVCNG